MTNPISSLQPLPARVPALPGEVPLPTSTFGILRVNRGGGGAAASLFAWNKSPGNCSEGRQQSPGAGRPCEPVAACWSQHFGQATRAPVLAWLLALALALALGVFFSFLFPPRKAVRNSRSRPEPNRIVSFFKSFDSCVDCIYLASARISRSGALDSRVLSQLRVFVCVYTFPTEYIFFRCVHFCVVCAKLSCVKLSVCLLSCYSYPP